MSILSFVAGVYLLGALYIAVPLVMLRRSWVKFYVERNGKPPNCAGEVAAVVLWPVFSVMRAVAAINNARRDV